MSKEYTWGMCKRCDKMSWLEDGVCWNCNQRPLDKLDGLDIFKDMFGLKL